jgi:hypothetical protein
VRIGSHALILLFVVTLLLVLMARDRPFSAGFVLALAARKRSPFLLLAPLLGARMLRKRRWRILLGWCAYLAVTSPIRSAWPGEWLIVRSKAVATYRTPTVWGVARSLLLVPLLPLFARARPGWLRWVLYWAATRSGSDVLPALVPVLAVLAFLAVEGTRRRALAAPTEAVPDA